MRKYKFIVWDWNGTLIDDLKMNFDILNVLLSRRSLKTVDDINIYLKEFCFPIIGFYEKTGFDLEKEEFRLIAREYAALYDELYPAAEIFPDAEGLLSKIKSSDTEQLIISQTEQGYLDRQVAYFSLESYFTDIIGNGNIYAGGKTEIAAKWLSLKGAEPSEVLFVGDTEHDKEVADAVGCDCVLISRGHNSRERLLKTGAHVLSSIADLEKELFL